MFVTITPFTRNALYADILFSAGGAVLMAAGAPLLSPWLDLPYGLLLGAGLVLIPWVIGLFVVARRGQVARMVLLDIVGINVLWAVCCFALLASHMISPNALGAAFIVAQALAVALLGLLQFIGIRRVAAA